VRQPFLPLTGHGGVERGRELLVLSIEREDRVISTPTEIIHVDDIISIMIYYRNGDRNSTSGEEALSQSGHGSSKPIHHEVMHSPWRLGGPWPWLIVKRGLSRCRPLLLGSYALRTPTRGGGGAQGLNFKLSFSTRVLFLKRPALSLDRKSPRARIAKAVSLFYTFHILM
jgi:hypothetical protein